MYKEDRDEIVTMARMAEQPGEKRRQEGSTAASPHVHLYTTVETVMQSYR
jgi:hypothetical protein